VPLPRLSSAPGTADGAAPVEVIETHMSWVFLAGDHALKLKKPVRYPFLDFSTLAAREACCREEVHLNQRLAPGVYRGLMAVQQHEGRLVLREEGEAPAGPTVDWLVWMKRLPREHMLDRRLALGQVTPQDIDALVAVLAPFYRRATRLAPDAPAYLARFEREHAVDREVLLRPQFQVEGTAPALERFGQALVRGRDHLRERAEGSRLVDGHGDLRPEHVCLVDPPVVIDCLEFNAALRQVDPFDELAFLALECDLAGAGWIGSQLVARCAAALHDAPPAPLLYLYTAARALLRARLAMAHLLDPRPRTPARWAPQAQHYVERALRALDAFERGDGFIDAMPRGCP
jgi:aminoglycoside phosphotransferase family enzyme